MKFAIWLSLLLTTMTAFGADKKISDLNSLGQSSWATGDLIPIVDVSASETKKTTIGDFDLRFLGISTVIPIAQGGTGQTAANAGFNALSPMTTYGDITYEDATPKAARLAGNTSATTKFLSQTGNGATSGTPAWTQPACSSLSNAAASCSTDTTNAANISSGTLPAARLPNPSSSTLGGIQSYASVSHQWINAISTGGVPSSTQPAFSDVSGSCTIAQGCTALTSAALGDIIYASATNVWSALGGNSTTTKKYLSQTGNGAASAAPSWAQPACGDLSDASASCATDATNASNISTGTLAIARGGTALGTTPTNGKILIGNGTNYTLANITQGANVTVTNGAGSITIAASSSATPGFTYTSQTSNYSANVGDWVVASGSAFAVTLPDASSAANQGKPIIVEHAGSNFTVYSINTTSAQTISYHGTTYNSGDVKLFTTSEVFEFMATSGGAWRITKHQADTGWINVGSFANYFTYTITSGSATIAATYSPAYVFTITAGNTASVGAVYSNNGHNYTLRKALLVGDTTAVFSGAASPSASGTLTYVSGTHTGGNLTFASVAGDPDTSIVLTIAKTVASGVTLIGQSAQSGPSAASGQLYKVSGTGDANIVYSSYTGSASDLTATTTAPVYYGSPINNVIYVMRIGNRARYWINWYQDTAGAVAGSGDFLFPIKMSGMTFDSTIIPYYSGGTAQTNFVDNTVNYSNFWPANPSGSMIEQGTQYCIPTHVTPYDSTHYRITEIVFSTVNGRMVGSTEFPGNVAQSINIQFELPVTGWLPQ